MAGADGHAAGIHGAPLELFCQSTTFVDDEGTFQVAVGGVYSFYEFATPAGKAARWYVRDAATRGLANPLDLSDADAVEACDALLRSAIADQMIADVSLGAHENGGFGPTLEQGGDGEAEARYLESLQNVTARYIEGSNWAWRETMPTMLIDYFPLADEIDHRFLFYWLFTEQFMGAITGDLSGKRGRRPGCTAPPPSCRGPAAGGNGSAPPAPACTVESLATVGTATHVAAAAPPSAAPRSRSTGLRGAG